MLDLIVLAFGLAFLRPSSPTPRRAIACEAHMVFFDYVLGGLVAALLLVYLVYALLRPERF